MIRKIGLKASAAALALGAALAIAPASAAGVKVGVLSCTVHSGWGFVFGSSKDLWCNYHPNKNGEEHYTGKVSKFGIDIGYTKGGVIVWDVVAPTSDLRPGSLEGTYAGATAGATLGVGGDVNVLVGGFDKSIALQPISIEGNSGINIAAGIGAITLKHTATE